MFGIVRPCRHVLCGHLFDDWLAHLCGLCLTLRAEHGQLARMVTNYDGLLVSVLVEGQTPDLSPRRKAGACALRGMRRADVVDARAEGARLAAATSLLLAAGKTRDHLADGDGPYARRLVASAAGRVAERWDGAGGRTSGRIGFDPSVLRDAVARQPLLEAEPGIGLLDLTEPAETGVAAVFAHTAVLARKEHNAETLAEAGRLFGRLAHLLDAVEDVHTDLASGAFNPLIATGTGPAEARRLCDDAVQGIRLALDDLDLENRALVRILLERELRRSVDQIFAPHPGGQSLRQPHGHHPHGHQPPYPPGQQPHGHQPQQPHGYNPQHYPPQGPNLQKGGGGDWGQPPGGGGFGGGGGYGYPDGRPRRPGLPIPCFTGTLVCFTCGIYQPKWSKHRRKSCSDRCWCTRHCDSSCDCNCCECCDCSP
ncbi:DUF5685 family protein [Spirillospora sp. CA-294931]|uniref:DUF5685 family protein n=1 Tax=Spirillospora sp. CA-294931 TaxID=3240042 RepID=UPI003D8DFBA1